MTRRQIREHIFRLLFQVDVDNSDVTEEQAQLYFEQIPEEDGALPASFSDEEKTYIGEKAAAAAAKIPEIDALIDGVARNRDQRGWKTTRMGKAELTILRLAVFEIRYDDDVPAGVAINEAVELAKKYGPEGSAAFVNGVLAKMA